MSSALERAGSAGDTDRLVFPCGLPLSPDTYHCVLDAQPTHLVPARLIGPEHASASSEALVRNPSAWLSPDGSLPAPIAHRAAFTERFAAGSAVVWVDDPATHAVVPYWLDAASLAVVSRLAPGEPAPADLAPALRRALSAAHVLVAPDDAERRGGAWSAVAAHARAALRDGWAPLGGLIHPYHLGALRRYYRRLVRKGALRLGDGQSPRRYNAHNEPVARFFHHQLRRAVSDVAGERLQPSYVYFVAYQPGAELPRHSDRAQCDFSVTLLLDHTPEPEVQSPWPIHLHLLDGVVTVFQSVGDALFYRGRQIPHHRDPLPGGNTSASLLFHYVREGFTGDLS